MKTNCRESRANGQQVAVAVGDAGGVKTSTTLTLHDENGNGWLTDIHVKGDNGNTKPLRSYSYTSDGKISRIKDYRKFREGNTSDYIALGHLYAIVWGRFVPIDETCK